jgi:hypothetical protein
VADITIATNIARKLTRRIIRFKNPFIRATRRTKKTHEQFIVRRDLYRVEQEIAEVAKGTDPIIVGPWLAEVGYEVLYWIPFLRWFTHAYKINPDRIVAVSRGGVHSWYQGIAKTYIELFDEFTLEEFLALNEARRVETESGGQKQSALSFFDHEILQRVQKHIGTDQVHIFHPSLMFELFKQFWFGNRESKFLFRRLRPASIVIADNIDSKRFPSSYVAVKFYTGAALPPTSQNRRSVEALVRRLAKSKPVVLLDTALPLDEHQNFMLHDIEGVTYLPSTLTPENNLEFQTQIIAGASQFIGTCGSLAWLAPIMGVPTVGVYADDKLLTTHLMVARQMYRAIGSTSFSALDLRALTSLELY